MSTKAQIRTNPIYTARTTKKSREAAPQFFALHFTPFASQNIKNKPNLNISKYRTSPLLLTTNDQRLTTREAQNKPNSNPNKPNYPDILFSGRAN
jgi:hypothetical protein